MMKSADANCSSLRSKGSVSFTVANSELHPCPCSSVLGAICVHTHLQNSPQRSPEPFPTQRAICQIVADAEEVVWQIFPPNSFSCVADVSAQSLSRCGFSLSLCQPLSISVRAVGGGLWQKKRRVLAPF